MFTALCNSQEPTSSNWRLSSCHSDACIKVNIHLNNMATVLFDTLTPRAMEYVKCKQNIMVQIVIFGHDLNLALAWIYA